MLKCFVAGYSPDLSDRLNPCFVSHGTLKMACPTYAIFFQRLVTYAMLAPVIVTAGRRKFSRVLKIQR